MVPGVSSHARAALVLLLVQCCLAGCGVTIEYRAQMAISADGATQRRTQFSAPYTGTAIREWYRLPPAGRWEEQKRRHEVPFAGGVQKRAVDRMVYRVERRSAPGAAIPADYVLLSEKTANTSANEIQLRRSGFGLFTVLTFEESFRDSSKARALMSIRALAPLYAEVLVQQLDAQFQGRIPERRLREAVWRHAQSALAEWAVFLNRENRRGMVAFETDAVLGEEFTKIFERAFAEDDEQFLKESLSKELRGDAGMSEPATRATVKSATEKVRKQVGNFDLLEPFFMWVCEDVIGVHGCHLFDDFVIDIELAMPGRLLGHNGRLQPDGTLRWTFQGDSFTWVPYRMRARSVVFHPARILLALSVCMLLASLGYRLRAGRGGVSQL
ncbi:MAG: hypothetical protein HYY48_07800 [Gammaproteobacteria bacterium]|nr:hypothetical protein [Gammaproteobacteria bacterium]